MWTIAVTWEFIRTVKSIRIIASRAIEWNWRSGNSSLCAGAVVCKSFFKVVQKMHFFFLWWYVVSSKSCLQDRYLHTNCLATLANMSPYFKNLAPVVCQKLIGLLEVKSRSYYRHVIFEDIYFCSFTCIILQFSVVCQLEFLMIWFVTL